MRISDRTASLRLSDMFAIDAYCLVSGTPREKRLLTLLSPVLKTHRPSPGIPPPIITTPIAPIAPVTPRPVVKKVASKPSVAAQMIKDLMEEPPSPPQDTFIKDPRIRHAIRGTLIKKIKADPLPQPSPILPPVLPPPTLPPPPPKLDRFLFKEPSGEVVLPQASHVFTDDYTRNWKPFLQRLADSWDTDFVLSPASLCVVRKLMLKHIY